MARRKAPTDSDVPAEQPFETTTPSPTDPVTPTDIASQTASQAATPEAEAQSQAPIPAPPKGERDAVTIDNRLGYRKEDTSDGRKRQIRFANRPDGQRPDDEVLAPVRDEKPNVSFASRERAWQTRKTPEGLEAIDSADQKLRELGRKRTGGQER